jgi:hypothetical protein
MPEQELPPSVEVEAFLVPTPDRRVVYWLEDIEDYISTEAYSR